MGDRVPSSRKKKYYTWRTDGSYQAVPTFPRSSPSTQIHRSLRPWDLQGQPPQQSVYPTPEPFHMGAPS